MRTGVQENGKYLGVAIAPGIEGSLMLSATSTRSCAAGRLVQPRPVIAKEPWRRCRSGLASLALDDCTTIDHCEQWLTLLGLRIVHDRNIDENLA
jgi:pantothenate kinase type III